MRRLLEPPTSLFKPFEVGSGAQTPSHAVAAAAIASVGADHGQFAGLPLAAKLIIGMVSLDLDRKLHKFDARDDKSETNAINRASQSPILIIPQAGRGLGDPHGLVRHRVHLQGRPHRQMRCIFKGAPNGRHALRGHAGQPMLLPPHGAFVHGA